MRVGARGSYSSKIALYVPLGSQAVKYCCPAGAGESRGDRYRVLASTEVAGKGRDGEGPLGLSRSHSYRLRHSGFPGVAAAQRHRQAVAGAGPLNVIVPVELAGAVTVVGLSVRDTKAPATCVVAEAEVDLLKRGKLRLSRDGLQGF